MGLAMDLCPGSLPNTSEAGSGQEKAGGFKGEQVRAGDSGRIGEERAFELDDEGHVGGTEKEAPGGHEVRTTARGMGAARVPSEEEERAGDVVIEPGGPIGKHVPTAPGFYGGQHDANEQGRRTTEANAHLGIVRPDD